MKTKSITNQVKGYYASQKLPPETVARIKSALSETGYQGNVTRRRTLGQILVGRYTGRRGCAP